MATIATFQEVMDRQAQGKAVEFFFHGLASGSTTSPGAAAGSFTPQALFNAIGTTLQTTFQGVPLPPGIDSTKVLRLLEAHSFGNRASTYLLCYLHRLGSIDLTSTSGNRLTHDSATFPALRKRMGVASQPITGLPFIHLTAATATTAPVLTLNGTDQDGNSFTGVKTTTFPAAATAAGTGMVPRLDDGIAGVRDISTVSLTSAASAGTANLYLLEVLENLALHITGHNGMANSLWGAFTPPNIAPPAATSGSLTSILTLVSFSTSATNTGAALGKAVLDG